MISSIYFCKESTYVKPFTSSGVKALVGASKKVFSMQLSCLRDSLSFVMVTQCQYGALRKT